MSVSTATATTATARNDGSQRVGRFAPSPTGALHFGSLVAAVGSYLDVVAFGGRWLLRIEDLDTPRTVPGCADQILRTLEAFGFEWFGPVLYQSARRDAYAAALDILRIAGRTYECSCTRKELDVVGNDHMPLVYPGTCRNGPTRSGPTATRFRVATSEFIRFEDELQGPHIVSLGQVGDVVVRRRDGLATYQLAVVVDDAYQGINRVVRGADLLPSTAWQIALQAALALPQVRYAHLPLITERDGSKLAKSRRSIAINPVRVSRQLVAALDALKQDPPPALATEPTREIWQWARQHWDPTRLRGIDRVQLSPASDTFLP